MFILSKAITMAMAQKNKGVFWRKFKWQLNRAKARDVPFHTYLRGVVRDFGDQAAKWDQRRTPPRPVCNGAVLSDVGAYELGNAQDLSGRRECR